VTLETLAENAAFLVGVIWICAGLFRACMWVFMRTAVAVAAHVTEGMRAIEIIAVVVKARREAEKKTNARVNTRGATRVGGEA
jgi:hypothetical protein